MFLLRLGCSLVPCRSQIRLPYTIIAYEATATVAQQCASRTFYSGCGPFPRDVLRGLPHNLIPECDLVILLSTAKYI